MRVPAALEQLATLRDFVEATGTNLGATPAAIADMVQAVDEAATNIILHGYRRGAGTIDIEVVREDDELVVRLRDGAPSFDPTTVPPPDFGIPFEERAIGGLGVFLMRQFTDRLVYRALPGGGNELTLARRSAWGSDENG